MAYKVIFTRRYLVAPSDEREEYIVVEMPTWRRAAALRARVNEGDARGEVMTEPGRPGIIYIDYGAAVLH